jgi:hypothetical protein
VSSGLLPRGTKKSYLLSKEKYCDKMYADLHEIKILNMKDENISCAMEAVPTRWYQNVP